MKRLFLILGLLTMISTAYADDFRLFLEGTDFNILSGYELNQIKKITFEEGQVVITKQDGNRNATAFSDINRIHFSTDPLPLAVEEVKTEGDDKKVVIYDFQGRKVENPSTGLYIINNKKVFIIK